MVAQVSNSSILEVKAGTSHVVILLRSVDKREKEGEEARESRKKKEKEEREREVEGGI